LDWMSTKPAPAIVEVWSRLLRTEKALCERIEARLKKAGLPSIDWYHILYEVEQAPKGMMRQSDVQNRIQLAQYNVCRLVARFEREGLMERHQCRRDGRNNVLVITPKGRSLRRAMWPIYATAIEELLGVHLTQTEAGQLVRLLG